MFVALMVLVAFVLMAALVKEVFTTVTAEKLEAKQTTATELYL